MRLTLDTVIDNPDLPLIEPALALVRPSTIEVFDMLSPSGITGALSLGYAGTFNSIGAVLEADKPLNTNVIERDDMTFIVCWNMERASGQAVNALGNLSPATAPFTGLRLGTGTNNAASFLVASGNTSPTNFGVTPATHTGAWTVQAYQASNSMVKRITHGGSETMTAVTSRVKSSSPIYLNGLPFASPITAGTTGTIGMFCAYNEIIPTAECVDLMDKIASIMGSRGVAVP